MKNVNLLFLAAIVLSIFGTYCSHNQISSNRKIAGSAGSVSCRSGETPALNEECPDLSQGIDENSDPVAEKQLFLSLGAKINEIQDHLQTVHHASGAVRGFHAKSVGCIKGTMEVLKNRPENTKYGIFANGTENKKWPIWVRFSNGVGFDQDDGMPDVRGMAIKVMGVPGPKYLDDEHFTQDFLMTNAPLPLGKDAAEFMQFAEANAKGKTALAEFALTHPHIGKILVTRVARRIRGLQNEQFWSGSPYHLGPPDQSARAVKFTAIPCVKEKLSKPALLSSNPNYLTEVLEKRIKEFPICFDFLVQFQQDPTKQPIEDTSVDWKESDTEFVPVARIILDRQPQGITSQPQKDFCDTMTFNPWHSIAEHRPLGNINRARKIVYHFISREKRALNEYIKDRREPDGSENFDE